MLTSLGRRHHAFLLFSLTILIASTTAYSRDRILLIDNFQKEELFCRGFKVAKQTTIDIHAVGALSAFGRDQMTGYGWIIRSGAVRPVWEMTIDNTEPLKKDKYLREYESTVELEPGEYEVYYYAGSPSSWQGFSLDLGDLSKALEKLKISFEGDKKKLEAEKKRLEREKAKLKQQYGDQEEDEEESGSSNRIVINGDEFVFDNEDVREGMIEEYFLEIAGETTDITRSECDYRSERVVAEILRPENDVYSSIGFSVAAPMQVEITAIGEYAGTGNDFADYGWIIDANTRSRVWSMTEEASEPAGGAPKNKLVIDRIQLPKGDYIVYYVTDDSHCYDDWNAAPPYNPQAYGIRINASRKDDLKLVKPFEDTYTQTALLSIVRADDDFFETVPFRVSKECDVRVYAIGEYGESQDAFADYGWIEKTGDSELYWEMNKRNTHHAGGASKNRTFDDVVHLTPGDYVLGYVTDDSHAYGDWNAGPPYDQKNYGISIFASGKGFDATAVKQLTRETGSTSVLAKLTYIGNDADETQTFVLDKPTRLHVVCLGEGVGSEMADYGWIERADNGDIVWEMTYRRSKWAGGAEKNRVVDSYVMLEPGKYRARYVTDGSHAFGDWNADPPTSPQRWGITVTKGE